MNDECQEAILSNKLILFFVNILMAYNNNGFTIGELVNLNIHRWLSLDMLDNVPMRVYDFESISKEGNTSLNIIHLNIRRFYENADKCFCCLKCP